MIVMAVIVILGALLYRYRSEILINYVMGPALRFSTHCPAL